MLAKVVIENDTLLDAIFQSFLLICWIVIIAIGGWCFWNWLKK